MIAVAAVETCGACGEQPLVCRGCGDPFCPCQIKNDPEGIWELCEHLDCCRDCVAQRALDVAEAFALLPGHDQDTLLGRVAAVRERRAEMRKGGTWQSSKS